MIPSVAGVYAFVCTRNGKQYIGQSSDLAARRQVHRTDLAARRHINEALQHDWDAFGADEFMFTVLIEMPGATTAELLSAEAYYMRLAEPGTLYNVTLGGRARLEYRYNPTHPAYIELQQEAGQLGISLQQLIDMLLISRYNLRHGLTTASFALWVPGEPKPPNAGAAALADEWL